MEFSTGNSTMIQWVEVKVQASMLKKNCMKQNSKHETERTTIENMGRSMALLLSLSVARNEGSLLQYSQRGES